MEYASDVSREVSGTGHVCSNRHAAITAWGESSGHEWSFLFGPRPICSINLQFGCTDWTPVLLCHSTVITFDDLLI